MARQPKQRRPRAEPSVSIARRPAGRRLLVAAWVLLLLPIGAYWLVPRPASRANLLLVTIDTLRADHVGAYGAAFAQTPSLDALAARGARFDRVQTPVPITGPSHATILTGLYPPSHGVRDNVAFPLSSSHKSLALLLKGHGYRTGGFVGAYPVAAAFGFRQGFDDWSENFKESDVPGAGAQRPANEVVDDVLAWLQQPGGGPFFAWIHLYDPHAPYDPPEPFRTRFAGRLYDGEIAFADAQLGRVFDWLRSSRHEADTLVAVLSDHGESLGEHGEITHSVLVYEATLRVPLVLAGPGVPRGRVVLERVTTVDLAPTLLRLVGVDPPPEMLGRDLGRALKGAPLPAEPLYAESLFGRLTCRWSSLRAWTADDWKLIDGSRVELFHLSEDPNELRNLAAAEGPRVERMRAALGAALGKLAPGGDRARGARMAPDQQALLRSLGYVGSGSGGGDLDQAGLPDPRDRVQLYERLQEVMRVHNMTLDQATAEAASIADEDPGNPFAQETVASLAYRAGRLAAGARGFRRTLELDPDYPAARQNYGKLLRDMNRLQDSERELRIVLAQADPTEARARTSLAETLILLKKRDEARRLISEALRIEKGDSEALAAQGRLLASEGKLSEAAQRLSEASRDGDPDTRIDLARVYLRAQDYERARATLEELLQQNPGHPWALAVMGETLVRSGQRDAGLALLRRAEAAHPRRPQAWLSVAAGFDAAGDPAAAARCRQAAEALRAG
jgi:arylsulfatase A-like enzyme/Tfp pilus assembly protein PilF